MININIIIKIHKILLSRKKRIFWINPEFFFPVHLSLLIIFHQQIFAIVMTNYNYKFKRTEKKTNTIDNWQFFVASNTWTLWSIIKKLISNFYKNSKIFSTNIFIHDHDS